MISLKYSIYRLDTGVIVSGGSISCLAEHMEPMLDANLDLWGNTEHGILKQDSDPSLHYVSTLGGEPVVMDRPDMPVQTDKSTITADGIDELTLTGLPDPCEIVIDDPDPAVETSVITATGGGFVFVAENPGTYTVQVNQHPFLPFSIEIVAT